MSERPPKNNTPRKERRKSVLPKDFEQGFWMAANVAKRVMLTAGRALFGWARKFSEYAETPAQSTAGRAPNRADNPLDRAVARLRRVKFTYPKFLVLALIVSVIGGLALTSQSIAIKRHNVQVMGLPHDLEGYTILSVSDLHGARFGSKQAGLTRVINGLKYDAIVMSGDMIGRGNLQSLMELLDGLSAVKPIYLIPGDSDPAPYDADGAPADWVRALNARGVTLLDAPASVKVGSANVWYLPESMLTMNADFAEFQLRDAGLWREPSADENYDILTLDAASYRTQNVLKLAAAKQAITAKDLVIGASHYPQMPDFVSGQSANTPFAADILISGHTCGGVWQVPFFGPLFIPMPELPRRGWFPDSRYVGGMTSISGTYRYINTGLGCTNAVWLPPFRLFNEPSVTLLKFTGKLT